MKKFYLLFLLMLLPLVASADDSGSCGENVTWTYVEESQKLVISGTGAMEDYVKSAPVSAGAVGINKVPWKSYRELIQVVEINDGVTTIGAGAFSGFIALTSVTIPNSVTSIGTGAFFSRSYKSNGLTSVTIPSGVTSIGQNAFLITDLSSINVDDGNQAFTSVDGVLFSKDMSKLIVYPANKEGAYTIPNSVTSIEDCAFSGAKCTSLTIPNSVTTIGESAFYSTSISSYMIPSSVSSIGVDAFNLARCSSIDVEDENLHYTSSDGVLFNKDMTTLIYYPPKKPGESYTIPNSVTTIDIDAFHASYNLTSVTIPSSVISIGETAFFGCDKLVSLDIPSSVTSIGRSAFRECDVLTSMIIPDHVAVINYSILSLCKSLTTVTLGSGVTSIENSIFANSENLKDVYCLAVDVPQTNSSTFKDTPIENMTLHVPAASLEAYKAADPWSKFGNIVPIDEKTDVDEITIKEIGKTTWCSKYDLDFTNVEGIKAYTATGYDNIDKTIWLTRVMKVPAGTGLLVKGDPGTYKIPHAEVQSAYANWFVGNLGETISISATDGDKTNYYLSGKDGTFVSVNGSANIGKNKAYLQLPTSVFGGTRSIGISYDDEDGTTSIKGLTPVLSEGEGEWYTLQGQRVAKPGKGLYIKNGKKVVIK